MNTLPDIKHEEFFIGDDKYAIRPVERSDFENDLMPGKELPDATASSVLFGLKPDPSKIKIDELYEYNSPQSFAFIAFKSNALDASNPKAHEPAGLALCAFNTIYQSHQFYLSIDKPLKSTRLATELLSMLANHAKVMGGKALFCHANEENIEMRALAERIGMSVRLETGKSHGVMYSMNLDQHPGIVKF